MNLNEFKWNKCTISFFNVKYKQLSILVLFIKHNNVIHNSYKKNLQKERLWEEREKKREKRWEKFNSVQFF